MTLLDSIPPLVNVVVSISKALLLTTTKWMWRESAKSEHNIESGYEISDDWSDELHLLFDDLVETII
jgi:hypothetical protein